MKLTPEQKAFYEYGKAREALRLFKTDFAYREETLREFYENYVCEAWQKRAACRAWVPLKERNCNNCMHLYRDTKFGSPCFCCTGIDDESRTLTSAWIETVPAALSVKASLVALSRVR